MILSIFYTASDQTLALSYYYAYQFKGYTIFHGNHDNQYVNRRIGAGRHNKLTTCNKNESLSLKHNKIHHLDQFQCIIIL